MNKLSHEIISELAAVCDEWTREELMMFVYDRLYDELASMTNEEAAIRIHGIRNGYITPPFDKPAPYADEVADIDYDYEML